MSGSMFIHSTMFYLCIIITYVYVYKYSTLYQYVNPLFTSFVLQTYGYILYVRMQYIYENITVKLTNVTQFTFTMKTLLIKHKL